jgi:hypothetical protein
VVRTFSLAVATSAAAALSSLSSATATAGGAPRSRRQPPRFVMHAIDE